MKKILSNPVKTDTEEAIEGVHIKQVMLFKSQKYTCFTNKIVNKLKRT